MFSRYLFCWDDELITGLMKSEKQRDGLSILVPAGLLSYLLRGRI